MKPRLHIVSNSSARMSITKLMARDGYGGDVCLFYRDRMNLGPLSPGTLEQRQAWVQQHLLRGAGLESVQANDTVFFWKTVEGWPFDIVVWWSRRAAHEFSLFANFLSQLDPTKDVYSVDVSHPSQPERWCSASQLTSEELEVAKERIELLDPAGRQEICGLWSRLQIENAPLRVIEAGTLASAPIDYFDAKLLKHVLPDWRTNVRVFGGLWSEFAEQGLHLTDEDFLMRRLQSLAEVGKLELLETPEHQYPFKVRRP